MSRLPIAVDKGKGQPVILLHGLGNNHKSWTHVLKALNTQNMRVIVPDLLGFGNAPKPDSQYTPRVHAAAVIELLDHLKVKNAIIAGHSMGCMVAIQIAKQRPDLAKQLVLLGPPLYSKIPKRHWWSKFLHSEGMYFTIFNLLKNNPKLTITAAESADTLLPLLKGMEITEETWPSFKASLNNTIMQTQSYKDVLQLRTPTLLVYGKLDVFVIKRNLKRAARKNSRHVKLITVLGPHEITPLQGKKVSRILQSL